MAVKPEAVHSLFHRPLICFKPDAAAGEQKFSGKDATGSVAGTVAKSHSQGKAE